MRTILLTGFGPFPGAPFNPTENLVKRLARARTVLPGVKVVPHVFKTSYAAVDSELPELLKRYRPDALLMFGLAGRTRHLRIETVARNAVMRMQDVEGVLPPNRVIASSPAAALPLRAPYRKLVAAAWSTLLPARLSRDAGQYLCNYLCWRAAEAMRHKGGPRLAVFVHVPNIGRGGQSAVLMRAGAKLLRTLATACR
jgi:pyroglutamyl-peptidase